MMKNVSATLVLILGLLALAAQSLAQNPRWSQPDTYPKRMLWHVRPNYLLDWDPPLSAAEAESAATYDCILSAYRPEYMVEIRKLKPDILALWNASLWGVPDFDYENEEINTWWLPDTLWSPLRKIQHAYIRNLKMGCDWGLMTVEDAGSVRYHNVNWNHRMLNITDECPLGVWGDTKGKTYREYITEVYIDILDNPEFTDAWDGIAFDTMPPTCCFQAEFDSIDYNYDNENDSCYPMSCKAAREENPWIMAEAAGAEAFFSALLAAKDDDQIITSGQDWILTASRPSFNGWKVEIWMRQGDPPPCSRQWICWWEGWDSPGGQRRTGYYESEQVLVPFGSNPDYDEWQGWDMTYLDATVFTGWSEHAKLKHARYALGTSMLGDGWYFSGYFGLEARYVIPEEFEWTVQSPAVGDFYSVEDPIHEGVTQWRRNFLRANGDSCIVVVDTLNADAYMFDQGACCVENVCSLDYAIDCSGRGGIFQGTGTDCSSQPCETGGCCVADSICVIMEQVECEDTWLGNGTLCTPNPCPGASGACCYGDPSNCVINTNLQCDFIANSTFYIGEESCSPSPCVPPPTGACCLFSGVCEVVTEEECDGQSGDYQGDETGCDPSPCPDPIGACCYNFTCTMVTELECLGDYLGDLEPCEPNPCHIGTKVTSLPFTASKDGERYYLTDDLATSSTGITVTGSDIIVDLQGFTISQTSGGASLMVVEGDDCSIVNGRLLSQNGSGNSVHVSTGDGLSIHGLWVYNAVGGYAMYLDASEFRAESSLFYSSTMYSVYIDDNSASATIVNCTTVSDGNAAVYARMGSSDVLDMHNCILARAGGGLVQGYVFEAVNASWSGLNATYNWYYRASGTQLIRYAGSTYADAETFEANSRDGDPEFVNWVQSPSGDWSVESSSGAINDGSNAHVVGSTDVVGAPRIADDTVDMGAWEFQDQSARREGMQAYDVGTPTAVRLICSGPNPFTDRVMLRLELPSETSVGLDVFDGGGRRVANLFEGRLAGGVHMKEWNGRDDGGQLVSSGVYFVRLQAGSETRTIRVLRVL